MRGLRAQAEKLPQRSTPPEGTFTGELREFQKEGLSFLLANPRTLLADEMGLGKTVQALACLAATGEFPGADRCGRRHLAAHWQAGSRAFSAYRWESRRASVCSRV